MNNELENAKQVIEVCLLTASEPISLERLTQLFDNKIPDLTILEIISSLQQKYLDTGLELLNLQTGYRFRSKLKFQPYLNKLYHIKPPRYSRANMEVLAIIAYYQPITRGEIENLRGIVTNSNVIQTLMERGWIEIVGQKQVPGKPDLFATTNAFLNDFNLKSLEELPEMPIIQESSLNIDRDIIEEYDDNKEFSN